MRDLRIGTQQTKTQARAATEARETSLEIVGVRGGCPGKQSDGRLDMSPVMTISGDGREELGAAFRNEIRYGLHDTCLIPEAWAGEQQLRCPTRTLPQYIPHTSSMRTHSGAGSSC